MKAKQQRKSRIDASNVTMLDFSEAKDKPRAQRPKKSPCKAPKLQPNAANKVAKFKEDKHLNIETSDLGQDEAEPDAEKPAPPSSTSKKRRRRSAAEIDRKHKCLFAGCSKAYGSEGSLIHHQKLKHPEQVSPQEKERQVGMFLLPLHNAPRNVTIRPATPMVSFATDRPKLLLSNQHIDELNALTPSSAKAPRRNLRSRSNSEPVEEKTNPRVYIPATKLVPKSQLKTPRKPRLTPRLKMTPTTARRTKLRSKSDSQSESNSFQQFDELKIPSYQRSDSTASVHEAVLPISTSSPLRDGSFEWPATLISVSGHHSTSLSSDEHAIDSDILSVLANCDAEDMSDSLVVDSRGGPSSTNSYQSSTSFEEIGDAELLPIGMEYFKITENAPPPTHLSHGLVMTEPEAKVGLSAFAALSDDWANALLLSDHLEKMSMAQGNTPPHSLASAFGAVVPSEEMHRLRSASDPVHAAVPELHHFSSMPLNAFSIKTTSQPTDDNKLVGTSNTNSQQWLESSSTSEAARVEDGGIRRTLWLSGGPDVAVAGDLQPTSEALDQLLQHDETLEWKPADVFGGNTEVAYALDDTEVTPTLLG